MELEELKGLARRLHNALEDEAKAGRDLAEAKRDEEAARSLKLYGAYQAGAITGKNDAERKPQESRVLLLDEEYQGRVAQVAELQHELNMHEALRKGEEAYVSLVKAWLYSQAKFA